MNLNTQHTLYLKFHPRLPHFEYNLLATDRVTQLFAIWKIALHRAYSIPPRPSTIYEIQKFRNRVDDLHRRRFLKAFAKARQPTKRTFAPWYFGMVWGLANFRSHEKHEQLTKYHHNRYWRKHIPNLP